MKCPYCSSTLVTEGPEGLGDEGPECPNDDCGFLKEHGTRYVEVQE